MKTKYTPGPWSVFYDHEDIPEEIAFIAASDSDRYFKDDLAVVYCTGANDIHGERRRADAALMAAAPELLGALKSLYDSVDSCIDLTPEVMLAARAALFKATGSTE